MFLLLFDFLLLLLVFHAFLTPDLSVGVPVPEHQTKYEKPAAKLGLKAVLRICDVYPESRNRLFFIPYPPQKSELIIPDPDPDFLPIPDTGSWFQGSKR